MKIKKEVKYIESQKYGWVAITEEDRDWHYGVTEKVMVEQMILSRTRKMRELHKVDVKHQKQRVRSIVHKSL
jgi:hypothetical protein|tara:strand:+ start:306 stop:521 length:216 start_codon:yes stop_codon:yes gene_type:complete